MKVLLVSHSSRPFVDDRVSTNSLERRFGSRTLADLPPFETLPPVEQAIAFTGALTLWGVREAGIASEAYLLRRYAPDYKVQSAAFYGDRLLVYGADRLEVLDLDFKLVRTIRHNWLVGGHTVSVGSDGAVWVSAAPANAVFRIDVETGSIVDTIPMPDLYGEGYALADDMDLHAHVIPTDLQPCHVNCAWPTQDGLLVTSFVPGAVGIFDSQNSYREIVRGYRGCHGGKRDPWSGDVYLTDSTTGTVLFLDPASGEIRRRVGVGGIWTHDAQMVGPGLLAVTSGDTNELRLLELSTSAVAWRGPCHDHGRTVMLVSCEDAPPAWEAVLDVARPVDAQKPESEDEFEGELVPAIMNFSDWSFDIGAGLEAGIHFKKRQASAGEPLASSRSLVLQPGTYRLGVSADCRAGRICVGVTDDTGWLVQVFVDPSNSRPSGVFHLARELQINVVIEGANVDGATPVDISLRWLSLRRKGAATA